MARQNNCGSMCEGTSASYGRKRTVTVAAPNGTTTTCSTEKLGTLVIRGNGTINSTGVIPDGSTCTLVGAQTEVDFTLEVYKKSSCYQGNLYMANYDTRKKVSSNRLIYYKRRDDDVALCLFEVQYQNGCIICTYHLLVSVKPTSCLGCSAGEFYAYAAPIYNEGVNIGGVLRTGEVTFYDLDNENNCRSAESSCCCSSNSSCGSSSPCGCS